MEGKLVYQPRYEYECELQGNLLAGLIISNVKGKLSFIMGKDTITDIITPMQNADMDKRGTVFTYWTFSSSRPQKANVNTKMKNLILTIQKRAGYLLLQNFVSRKQQKEEPMPNFIKIPKYERMIRATS